MRRFFLTIMCVVSMCNKIHEQAPVNLSQLQCVYRHYEIENLVPVTEGFFSKFYVQKFGIVTL